MNKIIITGILYYTAAFLLAGLLFLTAVLTRFDSTRFGLVLPQMAPLLALLPVYILKKNREIKLNVRIQRRHVIPLVLSLMLPAVFFIAATYCTKGALPSKINVSIIGIIGILIGSIGEEIGWRGFLQPLLEKKYSPFFSSVIVGSLWAIWHVSHFANGPLFMLQFVVLCVSFSIITGWYVRKTYGFLIPVILHTSLNFFAYNIGALTSISMSVYFAGFFIWAIVLLLTKKEYMFRRLINTDFVQID